VSTSISTEGGTRRWLFDGTSLSPSGHCEHAGYGFAFGLLIFDEGVPDWWLHVAKGDTGSLGQVEDVEETPIASC
jgi:hypothetical protein